jgi:probable HAF family extracellular repeat protein
MEGLGDLAGGGFSSKAYEISWDGLIIVGVSDSNNGGEAFRWTDSNGMEGLGDLSGGSFSSRANGISADGSVIIGYGNSASGAEAFRWTDSNGMEGLGDLSGGNFSSRANAVSADGSVVVGYSSSASGTEAFRWTDSNGMEGLGDLAGGSFYSVAYDTTSDGAIVVGRSNTASGAEAFIWDASGGIRNLKDVLEDDYGLDLTDWTLSHAYISDYGYTIAGTGINPSSNTEGWIVKLPQIYHVDANGGSDSNDGLSRATAFETIQKGIDTADANETVMVWPGNYLTPNEFSPEQIDINGKNITLTSSAPKDPNIVASTVIRGIVQFDGSEDANCVFTGFTIRDLFNGAIYGDYTHATISYCVISGNGPCFNTVLLDCLGTISNCLITDNTNYSQCGAPTSVVLGCHGVMKNCTIANNDTGVGILVGGTMTIENCIIYNNGLTEVSVGSSGTLNISYSDLEGGLSGISGSGDVNWGLGNIEADPCFVREGYWETSPQSLVEGDYHLKSEGWRLNEYFGGGAASWTWDNETSRCIDAGNPGYSLSNELASVPRDPNNVYGINLRIDMGCYGGTWQASIGPYGWSILSDLNNDGLADFIDFVWQANDWLVSSQQQPGDVSRDGIINMKDVRLLAEDWLDTTDWR